MSSCPAYADLIWYADSRETKRLAGHDPEKCPCCRERLDEYREIRDALKGLAGIEVFSPETLKAALDDEKKAEKAPPRNPAENNEAVGKVLAFIKDAERLAPGPARAKELLEQARKRYFKDWPKAEALAREARAAASLSGEGDNRMARALAASSQAEATGSLGYCLVQQGKHEEGLALLLDAHHRWAELGDPLGIGKNQTDLAIAYMYKKQLKDAEKYARQGIATLDGIGQTTEVAIGRQTLAIILSDLGKLDEALIEAMGAVATYREEEKPIPLGHALHSVSDYLFTLGRHAEARSTLKEARHLLESNGDRLSVARCDWLLGKIECADPATFSTGITLLDSAKTALLALDQWLEIVCLLCDKASLELGAGLREDARKDFDELLSHLPADRVNPWVSEAMAALNVLFERAKDDAFIRALGAFNHRLKAGDPPLRGDGAQTRH
jgi:tetratricopeptide (TPR) repeat protein